MSETAPHGAHPSLLAGQIQLLEDRRADVADGLKVGGRHDEILVDAVASDLVGVRLVIRAALAVPPPRGALEAAREKLERREREAENLLRVVLVALWSDGRREAPIKL